MKIRRIALLAVFAGAVLTLAQCKKKAEGADKVLFDKSATTAGFTYYKNDNTILKSSNPSAHNPYFRVRFNGIAQAALTDNGRLPAGGSFPEGSLVVKELYDSPTGALKVLAVMEKASSNSAAGAGWLWAEYYDDSRVFFSVDKKGSGCISCHSVNHRDYTRLFDLFP